MAKTKMICPFLGEPCIECAFYRGRHYYLCFCDKYRGYVAQPTAPLVLSGESRGIDPHKAQPSSHFDIPLKIPAKALDPFTRDLNDIV